MMFGGGRHLRSAAREDSPGAAQVEEEDAPRCMMCRSSQLEPIDFPMPIRAIRSLVLMVLPIPRSWLERGRLRCGLCGHEWTPAAGTSVPEP